MALKAMLKSLDGLSEDVKKFYIKKDDEYHLDMEGGPDDQKLAEFRDNNRKLHKQLNEAVEALKKYEGVDVERWKELQTTEQKLKDKQLIETGKIDELLNSKLDPIKKQFQTERDMLMKEKEQLSMQLHGLLIDEQLTKIATPKGLRPTAIDDLLSRGRKVFTLRDGKVVSLDESGATRMTAKGEALTPALWVDALATDAPHLFQVSAGGGANGNPAGSGNARVMQIGANGIVSLDPKSIEQVAKGELTLQR